MQTKYNLMDMSSTDSSDSSSESSVKQARNNQQPTNVRDNLLAFRHESDQKVFDPKKLTIYHITSLASVLAKGGFTAHDVLKSLEFMEILSETRSKLPKEDEYRKFADTVEEMSKLTHEQIDDLLRTSAPVNDGLRVEFSSMLHHLGVRGLVFVDPELQLAYTASEAFYRFVKCSKYDNIEPQSYTLLGLKQWLGSLKELYSRRNNKSISDLLEPKIFEVTGLPALLNTPIDLSSVMGSKNIASGTVRASSPLPILHPIGEGVIAEDIRQTVISRSIQDISGLVPVTVNDSAVCSQAVVTYDYQRPVPGDGSEMTSYYMPISFAAEGYNGDIYTNDVIIKRFGEPVQPLSIPKDTSYFANIEQDEGPFFRLTRRNVDCKNQNEILTEKDERTKEEKENDPDKLVDVSPHEEFHDLLVNEGKPIQFNADSPYFINVSYKLVPAKEFHSKSGIKVIDLPTYNVLCKEHKSMLPKYLFVVPSAFSQLVIAFPVRYARTELGQHLLASRSDKDACISVPEYIVLWPGVGKNFPVIASATYTATVLLVHKHHSIDVPLDELTSIVLDALGRIPRGKSKKSLGSSTTLIRAMVQAFWDQEINRARLFPFGPQKMGSSYAMSAFMALSEGDTGYSSYESSKRTDDFREDDALKDYVLVVPSKRQFAKRKKMADVVKPSEPDSQPDTGDPQGHD